MQYFKQIILLLIIPSENEKSQTFKCLFLHIIMSIKGETKTRNIAC